MLKKITLISSAATVLLGLIALPAAASHSWGGYHWARTANPFNLKIGNNLTSNWTSYLGTTISDWSSSTVLDTSVAAGLSSPRRCSPTAGRVEVCNYRYANNGWLGIASVWINGDHITQGTVKMNDSYFSTAQYDKPAWRNLVMCQEVGHTLGLDHQDTNFTNTPLGTCMDYSNDPTLNQHPNTHDYEELETIYAHLDPTTTIAGASTTSPQANGDHPSDWGKLLRSKGHTAVYRRDLGHNQQIFTFVIRP